MAIKAPKGTHDVTPQEAALWQYIEDTARDICKEYGYGEIRLPVFEHTELFQRGVGDTTDVVQKEMYTFNDKGGRSITLRPEGTAGVVRAYLENNLYANAQPTKLFYLLSCYRYEKPQAGRLREFHQFGVECFGARGPAVDAEIISVAHELFQRLGLSDIALHINSIGCPKCRAEYNRKLQAYFEKRKDELCETCRDRLYKNTLRILDCKSPVCQEIAKDAPLIIENLCEECEEHFEKLQEYLKIMNIAYQIDPYIVRGLDYYTKTVFEFVSSQIGAQGTVCGGGRYDGLVEELDGAPTPGIGFALGLERLILLLHNVGITKEPEPLDLFLVSLGEKADLYVQKFVYDLRKAGVSCDRDYLFRSFKAQMKYANKIGCNYIIVIGDDEITQDTGKLKNMATSEETEIRLSDIRSIAERIKQ